MSRRNRQKLRKSLQGARIVPKRTVSPAPTVAETAPEIPRKPGLLVRLAARILLSRWIIRRMQHPEARRVIAILAVEAGREDLLKELV
ncbi:MAG: hypothetical protein HQL37_15850 [Alphaproteobacteria bacterium]|nr:hypothetical protein [Alphaproteobacteria bacterium]